MSRPKESRLIRERRMRNIFKRLCKENGLAFWSGVQMKVINASARRDEEKDESFTFVKILRLRQPTGEGASTKL